MDIKIAELSSKIMNEYGIGMRGFGDKSDQWHSNGIIEQISNVLEWLSGKQKTSTVTSKSVYSYSAKHMVEKWFEKTKKESKYISNGALIIASIMKGFPVKRESTSVNAYIGISRKSLNENDGYGFKSF